MMLDIFKFLFIVDRFCFKYW